MYNHRTHPRGNGVSKKTFYFDKATMTVKEMEHLFVSLNAF